VHRMLQRPPPVHDAPVPFIAPDLARIDTAVLPFVRKPNGSIGWIDVGLRLVPRIGPSIDFPLK
jgi:hypothetical protein